MRTVYRIGVNIPPEFLEGMMDSLEAAVQPLYPGYSRAFCYWPVKGTWRTLEGSNPYNGRVGEITVADEIRLEFAVKEDDLRIAVETVRDNHPYEEPAIDVIPMADWKSIIPSDDS